MRKPLSRGRNRCGRARTWMCLAVAALGLAGAAAQASESGAHNVATGAETTYSAFVPAPGQTFLYGYLLWLSGHSLRNNAGAEAAPNFRADFYANAMQFIHTWRTPFFGATVSSAATYIVDYAKVKIGDTRDENGDLSDFAFQPYVLTAGNQHWHWMTGLIVYYPFGKYEPQDVANTAVHYGHYMTFIEEDAVTWTPMPWFELSLEPCLAMNLRDHRTGYRSGAMETLDWGTTMRLFAGLPGFRAGVGGFYAHQFTDDTQDGRVVPGKHLTKNGLGPQLMYSTAGGWTWIIKYQHETHAVNTVRANLLWLEFAVPLHF